MVCGEKGIRSPVAHVLCAPSDPPPAAAAHVVCAHPRIRSAQPPFRIPYRFKTGKSEVIRLYLVDKALICYGEKGIRTPGTFRYATFPRLYLKPLGHLSKVALLLFFMLVGIVKEDAERGGIWSSVAHIVCAYPRIRSAQPPFRIPKSVNQTNPKFQGINVNKALMDFGERGIRTPGPLRVNGFRDRPIRPLSHLSKLKKAKKNETKKIRTSGLQIRNLTLYPAEL